MPGRLQEALRAEDVGLKEGGSVFDAAIHVCFRGEVNNGVESAREKLINSGAVGNITTNKVITRIAEKVRQVFRIRGVGELVEIRDFDVRAMRHQVTDEVGTDEACSAGDENFHAAPRM